MMKLIANLLYRYGIITAAAPSYHGAFESEVPAQLRLKSK